jgi:hypothetical protein
MTTMKSLPRRTMLFSLGLGTGAYLLREMGAPAVANAGGAPIDDLPLLVFAYFSGGWDTLMSLDPRDHKKFGNSNGGIETGYDVLASKDKYVADLLAKSGGTGLVTPAGSKITFGPNIGTLANEFADLCVVRGINMGTLTHEVGRRYFITGKFPRGLAASGSSLPTWVASGKPDAAPIPNLVSGVESYNEGLDPRATGLKINSANDLAVVLRPVDPTLSLPSDLDDALFAFQQKDYCVHRQLDGGDMVAAQRAAYGKARAFMQGTLWSHFDFKANPDPKSAIYEAYTHFGVNPAAPTADLVGAKGQALIAAQALTNGVCQAVSIQPAAGLDTHDDDWETEQGPKQRAAWDAIADLISWLKKKTDPNGKPYWNRTVLVCFSEFARTPKLNVRGGRDHHLAGACLLAGKGIKGNRVIGGTTDNNFSALPIDVKTGAVAPKGVTVRPADIHATLCKAMGVSYEHISNQTPIVVDAILD